MYNGNLLLEEHDPPTVYDLEETLELAQDTGLRFGIAFCVLRFGSAFCLIEDLIAFCLREALPNSKPYEELTETDIKRMDADDQAIQTILLGLPEDVYAVVDSCETAKEIWERVRQMMNGSDIGEQEKKAKLFNEWEKFMSTDGESIESYYHRKKHFSENIASNLKFLNNLQPEWKRHVTIVRQTKNLHEADFTKIYDFPKMNQEEFPTTHKDQSSSSTHPQQSFPINNKYNPQPPLNQNFMQPPMTSLEDINDPTEAMNATLILFAKAFQLSAPTNNNQRTSSNPRNRQIAQPVINMGQDKQIQNVGGNSGNQFRQYAGQVAQNQQGFNAWQNGGIQGAQNAGVQSGGNQNGLVVVLGIANQSGTGNVVAARAKARLRRRDAAYLQTQLLISQKEEAIIQLQAEEFDFMAAAGDLDEIKEVNANCILMANLQQASTSGTQHDRAIVYDTDGSAEVHLNDNCYDNEIFNMFTQEEQYTDLLEPISKPQLVSQNDIHVTSVAPSMVHSGGTVETSSAPNEEIQHDPPVVYNSEETLELAQESREKMRLLKKEIKPSNYAKINHLTGDDTTPSVARKFLNKVKSSLVTLQCVVKQKMTLEVHNWSSSAYKEVYRIISHEIAPIINQVDARVQSFEIQFLREVAKFVRDFKSFTKEADESLDKQKSLELKIERLLKASVSHDIMSIVQNSLVDVPFDLRTELDRTKEKLELCIIKKEKEYVVLWNNWYTKCEECKHDKILYDKAYNDMQQKVELLQAQLRDLKGTSVTPYVDKPKLSVVTPLSKKLHVSMPSHSVPQPREFNVVKHRNVIAPGMFKINPSQTPRD
nr:hypothetical protein [Tanacetum cinerariifolium]